MEKFDRLGSIFNEAGKSKNVLVRNRAWLIRALKAFRLIFELYLKQTSDEVFACRVFLQRFAPVLENRLEAFVSVLLLRATLLVFVRKHRVYLLDRMPKSGRGHVRQCQVHLMHKTAA